MKKSITSVVCLCVWLVNAPLFGSGPGLDDRSDYTPSRSSRSGSRSIASTQTQSLSERLSKVEAKLTDERKFVTHMREEVAKKEMALLRGREKATSDFAEARRLYEISLELGRFAIEWDKRDKINISPAAELFWAGKGTSVAASAVAMANATELKNQADKFRIDDAQGKFQTEINMLKEKSQRPPAKPEA